MHYVCSDIHGQLQLYRNMLESISLREDDSLCVLGDMIDRGADGVEVLLDMMDRPNVIPFLGNHELMMLCAMEERDEDPERWEEKLYARSWLNMNNGGSVTWERLQALSEDKRQRIFSYLRGAWVQKLLEVNGKRYLLCHGSYWQAPTEADRASPAIYPEELTDIQYSSETMGEGKQLWSLFYRAVWTGLHRYRRDERVAEEAFRHFPDVTFVNGHVPVQAQDREGVVRTGNVLEIDGGCALMDDPDFRDRGCALLCLRLEDGKVFSISS